MMLTLLLICWVAMGVYYTQGITGLLVRGGTFTHLK
jgi:hypothetical protein